MIDPRMPLGRSASLSPLAADQQPTDERPGQADDQQLGPVDRLVPGQDQVRDPAGEHALHQDEQQGIIEALSHQCR